MAGTRTITTLETVEAVYNNGYFGVTLKAAFPSDNDLELVFRELSGNCNVERLAIHSETGVTTFGAYSPCALSRIITVRLADILTVHPSVQKITFDVDGFVSEEFGALSTAYLQNDNLNKLEFTGASVKFDQSTMEGIRTLLTSNALESLKIKCFCAREFPFSELFDAFQETTSLKDLHVELPSGVPSRTLHEIPFIIRSTKSLETVAIHGNEANWMVLASLAQAASGRGSSVRCISLECWFELHTSSAVTIGDMLRCAPALEEFGMVRCYMTPDVAESIVSGVAHQGCNVQILRLHACRLGNEEVRVIARAFSANSSVRHLHLGYNLIGNYGAIELGSMLEQNNAIATLDLSDNVIRRDGALASNNTLREMDVSNIHRPQGRVNCVGDEAASRFAQMLVGHSNVERIALSGLGAAGLNEFIARIPNMDSVVKLRLCPDRELRANVEPSMADSLVHAIELNTVLEELDLEGLFGGDTYNATWETINYLLDLNEAGRRIVENPEPNQVLPLGLWPLILGRASDSVDAIFYFLRKKPEIYGFATA